MCMVQQGMLSERVGSIHSRKHYVCASLVENAVCTCCALCRSMKKGLCKVTSKKTDVRESQGWRHWQEAQAWRDSLVSLLFQPCSSLRGCLSFSLSHCQHYLSYSYYHYVLHCSPPCVHTSASVAWPYMACQRGHMQCIRITWMGRTWSVSRSVGRLVGQSVSRSVGWSMHVFP